MRINFKHNCPKCGKQIQTKVRIYHSDVEFSKAKCYRPACGWYDMAFSAKK